VDAHGLPLRIIVTAGTDADCRHGEALIEGFTARCLLADKGYDTDAMIQAGLAAGMTVVIPPKRNRVVHRPYDKEVYKQRHLVENAFLHLKGWRGIATRYAKNITSFLAAVQIRAIFLWITHHIKSRVDTI
jgi:transposase